MEFRVEVGQEMSAQQVQDLTNKSNQLGFALMQMYANDPNFTNTNGQGLSGFGSSGESTYFGGGSAGTYL